MQKSFLINRLTKLENNKAPSHLRGREFYCLQPHNALLLYRVAYFSLRKAAALAALNGDQTASAVQKYF